MSDNTAIFTIRNLSHEGRGIGELNGKTTFIDGALPGETVRARLNKQRRRRNEATLEEVMTPSDKRIAPGCPHFGICGGCSLQHMSSDDQLQFKQQVLQEQLKHFAGDVQPETWLPPMTGPTWHYRHKARLGAKYVYKKEKQLLGFREKHSGKLALLTRCPVLHASVGEHLTELAALIQSLSIYQAIPQCEIAVGDNATAIILRHLEPLGDADLARLTDFAKTTHIWIYLQPKGPTTVHRLYPAPEQPEKLYYDLPEQQLRLFFEPNDFTQINPVINQRMIKQALDLLQLTRDDTVLELFCGLGNFSLALAQRAGRVVALEGDEALCQKGRDNARHNNIDNCEFIRADLYDENLASNLPWPKLAYNKVLLDPPRSGAKPVIEALAKLAPQSIVYVSCNPATLARDIGLLADYGYKLQCLGVMDMFPHTNHVESMALFERK